MDLTGIRWCANLLVEVSVVPGPVINTQKLYYLQYCLSNSLSIFLAYFHILINPFLLICILPHGCGLLAKVPSGTCLRQMAT